VNDTEENDAFQINLDHVRRMQESSEMTKTTLKQRKAESLARNDTRKEFKRFQNNVNKRFQTTKPTMLTRSEQKI
jgi:hypothetical protein